MDAAIGTNLAPHAAAAPAVRTERSEQSYGAVINIVLLLLWTFLRMANWVFVTLPALVLAMFSKSFQITLSLSSILMVVAAITGGCFLVVRYKYLTRYSRHLAAKEPAKKVYDVDDLGKKKKPRSATTSNYLDQFLSAIQVFGYLEPPVFHELTRNMTTQKVLADEVLYLDESLGFLIVVEGTIQVYTRVPSRPDTLDDEMAEESDDVVFIGRDKYQLLNEVKSGAPLLSLMSTLDLFTGDPVAKRGLYGAAVTPLELSPHNTGDSSEPPAPEIVARPKGTASTTLAIIPYTAFQRLHQKHPKATSHIVTMVLTRLYKVSMNTIYNYLGLSKDILDCERRLNDDIQVSLPGYLLRGIVDKLLQTELGAVVGGPPGLPRRSTANLRGLGSQPLSARYVVLASRSKSTHPGDLLSSVPLSRRSDYYQSHTIASEPDDLPGLHRAAMRRRASQPGLKKTSSVLEDLRLRGFSNEREETEETSLRTAIVENIFTHLGISEGDPSIGPVTRTSSASSSVVNLAKLGNLSPRLSAQSSPQILGQSGFSSNLAANYPQGLHGGLGYALIASSPRIDPMSTIRSGLAARGKVYHTISQHPERTVEPAAEQPRKNRSPPTRTDVSDFVAVKDEFSRAIRMRHVAQGEELFAQDSFHTGIFYVIDGTLEAHHGASGKSKKIYDISAGGICGYVNSVTGMRSLVLVRAPPDSTAVVAHLPSLAYQKLVDRFYFLQLPIARRMKRLLLKQFLTIDYALEWCHIAAGDVLSRESEPANGFHIVLSGRFRAVTLGEEKGGQSEENSDGRIYEQTSESQKSLSEDDSFDPYSTPTHKSDRGKGRPRVIGEYGHGDSIGEVEVLTASLRKSTLVAVRDSETARIPRALFELLSLQNPSIMVKVSRIVADRLSKRYPEDHAAPPLAKILSDRGYISGDFKTITVLPTEEELPVREFADRLVLALKAIGRNVIALDQASTLTHLGKHAFDEQLAELKLLGYFAYLEEKYETIVYVCDTPAKSHWTATCVSQGDCILMLADADDGEAAETVGLYEQLLLKLKTSARTDLCLIHPDKAVVPGSTRVWLQGRPWVQGHHHIQMALGTREKTLVKPQTLIGGLAKRLRVLARPRLAQPLRRLETGLARRLETGFGPFKPRRAGNNSVSVHKNDFLRLARILSNEAVGLVLGGGGSRGISHVGVVLALEKHGIPIDLVGGTSIGSFVGGLYAMDYNTVLIYGRAKKFAKRVSSFWRIVTDLTYPVTSYITGYEFNRGIWKVFGFTEIEDFWLRYFCNSTNITNSTMDVHETGYLWRFIRALMSLAGLLPPITYNGLMLLDGGYLDNLPVSEMKAKGAKYIIAVDVGSVDDRTPMDYGDTLSGFWVLLNRWNPFSSHPNVPNMMDIQLRLAYVASVNALEVAKSTPGVMYLRPPIENYATLDFGKYDEIFRVGFAYADNLFTHWKSSGKLPSIAGMGNRVHTDMSGDRVSLSRRNLI